MTALKAVRSRKTAKPPSFPQRDGASLKHLALFELVRARATFLSAIQGLAGAGAGAPMGEGKWSPHETVLHLVTSDRLRLREMEAALRGANPSWKGTEEADWAVANEASLAPLRRHDWEEALRLLHRTRQEMMEAIESVPEEPAEAWSPEHPFGWMLHGLPPHDRHHADQIKRWRTRAGA